MPEVPDSIFFLFSRKKKLMTVKKFLSVAKMAPTVYETETCIVEVHLLFFYMKNTKAVYFGFWKLCSLCGTILPRTGNLTLNPCTT